jgi:outer membrane protein, heavy metal efflux system
VIRGFARWLACWSLVSASTARAEVTLQEVLASVKTYHPLLMAELGSAEAATAEARAARGELDLTVTAQARAAVLGYYDPQRVDLLLEQPTTLLGATLYSGYRIGRGRIAPYYGEQATLEGGELRGGVRVPLWQDRAIDARRAGIGSSRAGQKGAEANLRATRIELERDAALVYFSWVAAGLRERVAVTLLKLASERDAQIASKVALGALPSIEQLDNQRAIMDRKQRLVQACRVREKLGFELSLYLRDGAGRPRVASAEDLPAELGGPQTLPSVTLAAERALRSRPELDAYEAMLEQARIELSLAENRVAPRVDVFGEVSKDLGAGPSELVTSLQKPVVEVGATLSLPLWLRKARGKRDAAEAKLQTTESKADYARDKVVYEVRDAYSAERAATERVQAARSAAILAEQLARGERTRLELGATTLLFVNLREQQAADAEVNVIDAMAEWNLAHARARAAMGDSLVER